MATSKQQADCCQAAEACRFQEFPPSSVLSELGIREFDVLKSINGTELKDLSTLSLLFTELKNTNRFEVEIERYGRPLTLRYTLK